MKSTDYVIATLNNVNPAPPVGPKELAGAPTAPATGGSAAPATGGVMILVKRKTA